MVVIASAETARLIASLELKDNMSKGLNSATAGIGRLEGKFNRIGGIAQRGVSSAITNITRLGLAAGVAIAGAVGLGIRSLADLARTEAQTNAVIASTGGAAGQTAASIREQAEALEKLSTVDDKVIQDGQNMLLTFTNIGGKVFPRATKAALNLAVAMAGGNVEAVDLKASAIQLGKALNDPIKGITALRKVGVAFTEAQIKQIKALVKTGDIVGAQTVILKELEVEFGNAAEAAGTGPEASWRRLQDVGEDLSQTIARGLLPVLVRAADWLSTKLADPAVIKTIDGIGQALARVGSSALDFIETVDFKGIADSLGVAVGFAKGIVDVFMGMPDWVKQAVITGWGLNKLTGGAVLDLGKLVVEQFAARGATPANPLFVADVAKGLGGASAIPGAAGSGLGLASKVFLVGEAIGLALLVNEVRNGIAQGNTNAAKALTEQSRVWLALDLDRKALEQGLAGVEAGILEIARTDPQGLVQGESLAELKAIRQAILDRLKPELFGPPAPKPNQAPGFRDSPRTVAASAADIEAILARGRAAGFKPTWEAALNTNQRNLSRLAEEQIVKTEAVEAAILAGDTRSELAGIAMAIASQKPVGTGGLSPDERGEQITASQMEAIQRRAIEAGFRPSASVIQQTFDKNKQHLIDIKTAVAAAGADIRALPTGFKNALGGILYQGGGRPAKDDVYVPPGWPPMPAPIDLAGIEAILARGRAAGFSPTLTAAQATNQRNMERLASEQITKTEAVRAAVLASDTRSELAGIRLAIASSNQQPPTVQTFTTVNVTGRDVQTAIVTRNRVVKPGGSRTSFNGSR